VDVFYNGKPQPIFQEKDFLQNNVVIDWIYLIQYNSFGQKIYYNVNNIALTIKYNGSIIPATGSSNSETTVNVVVSVTSPIVASCSFSYKIQPQSAELTSINFQDYSKTYDGLAYNMQSQFSTNSTATPVFTYTGTSGTTYGPSSAPPVNSGKYLVNVSVPSNSNFSSASATAYLTINKITKVSNFIFNTNQSYYNGSARPLTCSTTPSTLQYIVYYDGATQAPSAIGSYSVVARITDSNVEQTALNSQIVGTYNIVRSNQLPSTAPNTTTLIRATYVASTNKFLVDFIGTYQ
jgi:hypothetical protein